MPSLWTDQCAWRTAGSVASLSHARDLVRLRAQELSGTTGLQPARGALPEPLRRSCVREDGDAPAVEGRPCTPGATAGCDPQRGAGRPRWIRQGDTGRAPLGL